MRTPGSCEHETETMAKGKDVKSCCMFSGRMVWTNCRWAGHCLFRDDEANKQLNLLDEDEEEDCE